MDGADPDQWSDVAAGWAELWGGLAAPAWRAVVEASAVGPGSRVLDVGCGSGDFLEFVRRSGATATGIDPAPGMVRVARSRLDGADIRLGSVENLPWPDAAFDLVTAFNSLQFADDTVRALAELVRVAAPGGVVAVANWAEDERNDLAVLESAVAAAAGEAQLPDGYLQHAGGLEAVFGETGLVVVAVGLVDVVWEAAGDAELVRGVLLGEDPETIAERGPAVVAAAREYRTEVGGYRLVNAFRYAVGRT